MKTILGVKNVTGGNLIPVIEFNWDTKRYALLKNVFGLFPNETKLYVVEGNQTKEKTFGDVRKYMFDNYKEVF